MLILKKEKRKANRVVYGMKLYDNNLRVIWLRLCVRVCVWSLLFLYHFLYLHSSSHSFLIGKCYYYYLTVERIWSIQKINFFSALDTNWCCRLVKFKFDWHWSNRLAIRWDLLGSRNQALIECKSTSTIRYDVFVLNLQF